MATNVTMPKLGLSMETGKINEWKVDEGGEVFGLADAAGRRARDDAFAHVIRSASRSRPPATRVRVMGWTGRSTG